MSQIIYKPTKKRKHTVTIVSKSEVITKTKWIQENIDSPDSSTQTQYQQMLEYITTGNQEPYESISNFHQSNQRFGVFPYAWIWINQINNIKFISNSIKSREQIHVVQDFSIEKSENGTEFLQYHYGFVAVWLKVLKYNPSQKRLVAICTKCSSCGDLSKYDNFQGKQMPSFRQEDLFGCEHSTSVAVFLLKKMLPLKDIFSIEHAYNLLIESFSLDPEQKFSNSDWIDIPKDWACKYGYICLFVTSEKNLRLFAASQPFKDKQYKLYCFLCKRKNCNHVKDEVRSNIPIGFQFDFDDDFLEGEKLNENDLISKEKYPFLFRDCSELSLRISDRAYLWINRNDYFFEETNLNGIELSYNIGSFNSKNSVSKCCSQDYIPKLVNRNGWLYLKTKIYRIKVFSNLCSMCKTESPFDGREYGIVNYRNIHLFGCELFYELLNLKLLNGTTTNSWWKNLIDFWRDTTNYVNVARLSSLSGLINRFFSQFLTLLEQPNYTYKCCEDPEIITLDGLVLSIETKRIMNQSLRSPWVIEKDSKRATTRESRSLIMLNIEHVSLIENFTGNIGLIQENLLELEKSYNNPCIDFLLEICRIQTIYPKLCPPTFSIFFRSIRKKVCPALSIAPKRVWSHIIRFISDNISYYDSLVTEAKKYAPVLLGVLNAFTQIELQHIVMDLLKYILIVAQHTATAEDANVYPLQSIPFNTDPMEELLTSGVCFPNRPVVRHVTRLNIGLHGERCSKFYKGNSRLGSGIVLFWCGKHRICLGWVILSSAESLEVVYNTIVTRFAKIPKIICYDNACNLAEYCYNRAPSMFSDTIFAVDAFHFKGHVNCSHGFNSGKLLAMKEISSVLHEQKNALLSKLKIACIFMRFDSFVRLIYSLTSLLNLKELKKR